MYCQLAILCALEIEASPIKKKLEMIEVKGHFDQRTGLKLYKSQTNQTIFLAQFGRCSKNKVDRIGTQIASIAAWEVIRTLNPKTIVSAGTAGGFRNKGAKIGDVYYSNQKIYFHGRHIPVPEYKEFELGGFATTSLPNLGSLKQGIISSGDSIPASNNDLSKMNKIGTDAKDMEAAAIAEIAEMTCTPMFALKSISDFVDSPISTHEQFLANFNTATNCLAKSLGKIILENYNGE